MPRKIGSIRLYDIQELPRSRNLELLGSVIFELPGPMIFEFPGSRKLDLSGSVIFELLVSVNLEIQ